VARVHVGTNAGHNTYSEYLSNIMAFPVPDHLPKRPTVVDVSSTILYKIDSATKDTLNSSLAASWIHELDKSIQATKVCIMSYILR